MACPLCGDRCTCSYGHEGVTVLIDPDQPCFQADGESFSAAPARRDTGAARKQATLESTLAAPQWRHEISNRVQAHKARRGGTRNAEDNGSLSFGFDAPVNVDSTAPQFSGYSQSIDESDILELEQAISADSKQEPAIAQQAAAASVYYAEAPETAGGTAEPRGYERVITRGRAPGTVITFPMAPTVQQDFLEELADPILSVPRILDAADPEPAPLPQQQQLIASIHLDNSAEEPLWVRDYDDGAQDEFTIPLQVAPLAPRFISAVLDASLVLTALAVFSITVLSGAHFMPQGKAAMAVGIVLPAIFWLGYNYLFLVFGGTTPGMTMAQIHLSTFEGCQPNRRTRSFRALAMMVSCISLGLGFAWSLVDEDTLSWHDRITRTYLRQS